MDVDQVAPTKMEQSMTLKYRPYAQFHWLSNQEPEEVAVFTSWDSVQGGTISSHTPHGAHIEDNSKGPVCLRESVEVRLIVMWAGEAGHESRS